MKAMNNRLMPLLAVAVVACCARAEEPAEDSQVWTWDSTETPTDLRTLWPVTKLVDEPALTRITYSAFGWRRNAAADPARKATITARAGTLADGVFTPDGSAEVTVLPATEGEGTITWAPATISKKVYRLMHQATVGSKADEAATCSGYFDFRECTSLASQEEVEQAVMGAVTHPITVTQDAVNPWQPINPSEPVRSGLTTSDILPQGTVTTTSFSFKGRGAFRYEYALTGGTLTVVVDGVTVAVFSGATGWTERSVDFDDFVAHEVAFVYSAGGDGAVAKLRNVRWEEPATEMLANGLRDDVRSDLQEGVRTPRRRSEILPFEYSSTNWIGDVAGVTSESIARVAVVQLEGTDPCITNWTEVAGTEKVLKEAVGEGEVLWRAEVGRVWKATFEITTAGTVKHAETCYFDLRKTKGNGLVLYLK